MKKIYFVLFLIVGLPCISHALDFGDIRRQVRYDICDTTETININTRFPDDVLNIRINEAQDYIVRYTKCLYARNISTCVAEQQEYLLPSDCYAIDRVRITGSPLRITGRTLAGIDNEIPSWQKTSSGIPRYYYRLGNYMGLYPKPSASFISTSTGTIEIEYFQRVTPMSNDVDLPFNGDTALQDYSNIIIEAVDIACGSTMNEDTSKIEARYKFDIDNMKAWSLFRYSNDINENIQTNR